MSAKLYRAVVMNRPEQQVVLVLFEIDVWHGSAESQLSALLSQLWCVRRTDLFICSLRSEAEQLNKFAFGCPLTGDARLLEASRVDGEVVYVRRDRTLLLVTPNTLRRLHAAQDLLQALTKASA